MTNRHFHTLTTRPTVKISENLAQQLDVIGNHFLLIDGKKAFEKDWNNPKNLMKSNDPRLLSWLERGENYGVAGGGGVTIIETDNPEVAERMKQLPGKTFTVKSGGKGLPHFYILSSVQRDYPLKIWENNPRTDMGYIKAEGGYVVGPNSLHPETGKPYEVICDAKMLQVNSETIFVLLDSWIRKTKSNGPFKADRGNRSDVPIDVIISLTELEDCGHGEYRGAHPFHPSKTGWNFKVDTNTNTWRCWGCDTGGNGLKLLAIKEGIIKCGDSLIGENRDKALRFAMQKCLLKSSQENKLSRNKTSGQTNEPKVLEHINQIEDPNFAGKPVEVEAIVSSTSIAYLVPKRVAVDYKDEENNMQHLELEFDGKDPINVKLVGINEGTKQRRLNTRLRTGRSYVKDVSHRSVYRIRIRPQVFTLEKCGEKIIDEKGFEYKAHDIYVTSERHVSFQPSSLIHIEGLTLPNPKTQKTTLLAYQTDFPEDIKAFNKKKLERLKEKFSKKTVSQRLDWILSNFEIYSQIVGRRNLAKAGFLIYFTPTWVNFDGNMQRGWGVGLCCGDTTVGKSETQRKMISLLNAGMLITAETASTVGLTGTATQVEREGWFVDWGFLVLLDRKLLVIDGAHKLSSSNWACLAEAERSGVVNIAKAAKNSAYARTRQIKIANAVDIESNKYSTKSLANFLYPCQAITTILDKTSIARLDVAVFADQRDVSAETINKKMRGEYDKDLELLSEVLRWCWNGSIKVEFTDAAIDTLLAEATALYAEFFSEQIPLISIDTKWKLARLSVALAFLTISTTDFNSLTVTEEHVNGVVEFLRSEYAKAGLNALAKKLKIETLTAEDVWLIITRIIEETKGSLSQETVVKVFEFLVLHNSVVKDQIKTKFDLSDKNQLRPLLAVLDNEGLIKRGRGFYSTPKLIQAYKITESPEFATIATFNNPGEGPPNVQ